MLSPLAERLQRAVAKVRATSRSAGCPGSRTRCCRPDGRRRAAAAADDHALIAGDVVGRAEARTEDERRPGVAVLRDAVAGLPDAVGAGCPSSGSACRSAPACWPRRRRSRIWPVRGSIALRVLPEQVVGAVAAARRRRAPAPARRPLIREEVRHLLELVVLRLLAREPHAVVERQPVVHLPVVLDVELGVVVDHAAFDELRRPAGTA